MLVHMHRTGGTVVRITAGGIIPGSSRARCKPDVESIKENPIRIVRIHDDSLVVPVLWVIAGTALAVSECAALRAFHEGPACTAIRRSPGAYLAARCVTTTSVTVTNDRLCLSINIVRDRKRHV